MKRHWIECIHLGLGEFLDFSQVLDYSLYYRILICSLETAASAVMAQHKHHPEHLGAMGLTSALYREGPRFDPDQGKR